MESEGLLRHAKTPILSHINPVHASPSHFLNINFNIIQRTPCKSSPRSPHKNPVFTSPKLHGIGKKEIIRCQTKTPSSKNTAHNTTGVLISRYLEQETNKLGSMSERPRFQQHRDACSHQDFFLQGKVSNEIHAILTETFACFLPGRARNLSAPLYDDDFNNNTL